MKQLRLRDCDIVTIYDPARSRETEYGRQARNAIMTMCADSTYNVYVLDYWAKRGTFELVWEEIKRHVERFRPRCIGVEDVAVQMAIGEAFTALARRESVRIPFIESVRPDTRVNKKFRIRTNIQRVAPYGKLFIPPDSYELVSEWKGFPNGRTIDLLDVLAYGIAMLNIPGGIFAEDYNASVEKAMEESREAPREVFDGGAVDEEYYMLPPPPETLEERMIRVN